LRCGERGRASYDKKNEAILSTSRTESWTKTSQSTVDHHANMPQVASDPLVEQWQQLILGGGLMEGQRPRSLKGLNGGDRRIDAMTTYLGIE
jgi:hypothetical protein